MLQRTITRTELYRLVPITPIADFLSYYENGTLTKERLASLLSREFVGKGYSSFSTRWGIGRTVQAALENSVHGPLNGLFGYREEGANQLVLRWREVPFAVVTVSKKKGRDVYSALSGHHCEWTVKAVEVEWTWPELSLVESIARATQIYMDAQGRATAEEARLVDLAAKLMVAAGTDDLYLLTYDLEKIIRKRWETGFSKAVKAKYEETKK